MNKKEPNTMILRTAIASVGSVATISFNFPVVPGNLFVDRVAFDFRTNAGSHLGRCQLASTVGVEAFAGIEPPNLALIAGAQASWAIDFNPNKDWVGPIQILDKDAQYTLTGALNGTNADCVFTVWIRWEV